ncbi:hypothetical protein RLO149_c020140 [Roseobacter litoralis Och 149]|uniref:Uncharacterized protein n=2 Tax=Roseobacteraceae TaxID=2854170 RepID=F7ZKY7_ROSLO|nr:hypothetical protein RLO149_c020140 [Roseobacter litoralis Och 149]
MSDVTEFISRTALTLPSSDIAAAHLAQQTNHACARKRLAALFSHPEKVPLMQLRFLPLLIITTALTACGFWPDLPEAAGSSNKGSKYPVFVPLDKASLPSPEQQADEIEAEAALAGRIARLRARAADLRSTSVE